MTLWTSLRVHAALPILIFTAGLGLAGCATQPAGPVMPVPADEQQINQDIETTDSDLQNPQTENDETQDEPTDLLVTDGPFTPPHMQGRQLTRIGIVLPFSHPRDTVRQEAENMLAGIELALFDQGRDDVVLLPANSGGSQNQTRLVSQDLLDQGADILLGPLFGAGVVAAHEVMSAAEKPVIAFSNDTSVADYGAFLASISPEAEVASIVEYAALSGYQSFAFFGPQNGLGKRVESAMQEAVSRAGGVLIASGYYPASTVNPDLEAKTFAETIAAAAETGTPIAVLVPERGNRLRRIAPLLAYYGIDTRQVKMLGMLSWNDPEIWREPSLSGAWFPAAPVARLAEFRRRYERQYGVTPSSLAGLAYDAAALAIALSADGPLDLDSLLVRDGFNGVNGLFRFRSDGTNERSLAIMEITPNTETGVTEILPVSPGFDPTIG